MWKIIRYEWHECHIFFRSSIPVTYQEIAEQIRCYLTPEFEMHIHMKLFKEPCSVEVRFNCCHAFSQDKGKHCCWSSSGAQGKKSSAFTKQRFPLCLVEPVIPETQEVDSGESQIQGWRGLQSEFKGRPYNWERPYFKTTMKSQTGG